MLEEDSDQVAPGLRLSGRGRVLARAHDGWVCACWDRCCCLLCQRETATSLLQVCAFLSGLGCMIARAHDGWACICWDRRCCLSCWRETAPKSL